MQNDLQCIYLTGCLRERSISIGERQVRRKQKRNHKRVRKPQIDVRCMPVVGRAIVEYGHIFK
jgi:hypothetical protein